MAIGHLSTLFTPDPGRRRLLVLNTYGVYPADTGGKKRIFYLYQAVSRYCDVTLLNLGQPGGRPEFREFNAHFRELRVPPDHGFLMADAALYRVLRKPVTDIAAMLHAHEITLLTSILTQLLANTDVVVASHVYLYPLIARHWRGELWYDSQNVEADMKADILGVPRLAAPPDAAVASPRPVDSAVAAVAEVARMEGELVRSATRVLAVSEQNVDRFSGLYGRPAGRIDLVPNGVQVPDDPWLEAERRGALKASLGCDGRPAALFVASNHGPNHEAADIVVDVAGKCPEWLFWVAGNIGDYLRARPMPGNVQVLGLVTESALESLLRAADVGLNPMLRGSGTNLKMLDYAAHGALTLSTEVGARGLGMSADVHYLPVEAGILAGQLAGLAGEVPGPRTAMRAAARAHVENRFSWATIAERMVAGTVAD